MTYDIVSYCSENYADAYEFVIDSWVRTKAARIFIYTDTDKIESHHPKVTIIPHFLPSTNWLVSVERKILAVRDYVNTIPNIKNFAFMDIDCLIVEDFSEVFAVIQDIGITRLLDKTPHAANTCSAAPWYGRLTPGTRKFIAEWNQLAQQYKAQGHGTKEHKVSFVQYSMTDLLKAAYNKTKSYHCFPLQKAIYNCEDQDVEKWLQDITKHKSKVLHFKRRRFRDTTVVRRVQTVLAQRWQ